MSEVTLQGVRLIWQAALERTGSNLKRFDGLQPEGQGQNLAVTVCCVRHSLDSSMAELVGGAGMPERRRAVLFQYVIFLIRYVRYRLYLT